MTPGNRNPGRAAAFLLRFFLPSEEYQYIAGDFLEEYHLLAEEKGKFCASLWYWILVFEAIPGFIYSTINWNYTMLKNYLKITVRNLWSSKIFTFINISGLSVAIAGCLLIYLFIADELSFDQFHENADNIYSIINTDNYYNYNYRFIPTAVGTIMKEFFPEVKSSVRVSTMQAFAQVNDLNLEEQVTLVDPEFFQMFFFKMIPGQNGQALASENSVILTASAAKKYFQDTNPLGKSFTLSQSRNSKVFTVTGIIEDPPSNSSIQFSVLLHFNNYAYFLAPREVISFSWPRTYTYVELKEGTDPEKINARFPYFVNQYFDEVKQDRIKHGSWNKEGETITFWLQNIKDMYLHSQQIAANPGSDIRRSYIIAGIGILVLQIAIFNFINLSVGRAASRTVEIGIRKVIGAEKRNIIGQYWSDSVLISMLAAVFGVAFALLIQPVFNTLAGKNISVIGFFTVPRTAVLLLAVILIGICAGSYPGAVVSRFRPVLFLKGSRKFGGKNAITRIMIGSQFAVSVFLIIATMVMGQQIRYINTKDLGYDKNGVIIVETLERDKDRNVSTYNVFRDRIRQRSDIYEISGCLFPLSGPQGEGMYQLNGVKAHFNFSQVYYNYATTMGMRISKGRDFSEEYPADTSGVIVNRKFTEVFKIDHPIGTHMDPDNPASEKIIGVVGDFHYSTLQHPIEPVIQYFDNRHGPRTLLFRVSEDNIHETVQFLEKTWKEIQPDKPFLYSFLDEKLAEKYDSEVRWNKIIKYSSFLAIIITCMGLVGMTTITVNRRIKEIGIRKVLGASVPQIGQLLFREFLWIILAANIIIWPAAWYFLDKWLQNYAYRTTIDFKVFLASGIFSALIAIVTISFQVLKAAYLNPVKNLRYE